MITHNNGSGMTHSLAGRRSATGDERHHWLLHGARVVGRLFFESAADLADKVSAAIGKPFGSPVATIKGELLEQIRFRHPLYEGPIAFVAPDTNQHAEAHKELGRVVGASRKRYACQLRVDAPEGKTLAMHFGGQ